MVEPPGLSIVHLMTKPWLPQTRIHLKGYSLRIYITATSTSPTSMIPIPTSFIG
jgi:hypothetical protein